MWTCQWLCPCPPQTTSPGVIVSLSDPSGSSNRCDTRQPPLRSARTAWMIRAPRPTFAGAAVNET